MKMVGLVAAHDEQDSVAQTVLSLLNQDRRLDRVVVAVDNCTDGTLAVVRAIPGVEVFETEANLDKKPGALNQAWARYCADADLVLCVDADTTLTPSAAGDWEREFLADPRLGGCSARFTMRVTPEQTRFQRFLVRLQKAEFAKWTDLSLRRGATSVLAGTACCIRNQALWQVRRSRATDRGAGPWTSGSMVEDFELTYRMRQMGWTARVSPTVRAYTDAMTDLRSLWAQRMKWQTGTVEDLLGFGFNRLTLFDWWQQAQGVLAILVRLGWLGMLAGAALLGSLQVQPLWLIPPLAFVANDVKQALRIPDRQSADLVVAALLVPQELFAFMRAAWFAMGWSRAIDARVLGYRGPDLWAMQALAESRRIAAA